jgi:hypothetical protein
VSTQDGSKVYEALMGFRGCNRYQAHAKIDDVLRSLPRETLRCWHPSVVEVASDVFVGSIRTNSAEVQHLMNGAKWTVLVMPAVGDETTSYIEVAPKTVAAFGDFHTPKLATQYVESRIATREVFDKFSVEYVARTHFEIAKFGSAYHGPSAWFKVTGKVKSVEAFENLVIRGIGGSKSFGMGLLTPESSKLFGTSKQAAELAALFSSGGVMLPA